jgi:hypothetical protein
MGGVAELEISELQLGTLSSESKKISNMIGSPTPEINWNTRPWYKISHSQW